MPALGPSAYLFAIVTATIYLWLLLVHLGLAPEVILWPKTIWLFTVVPGAYFWLAHCGLGPWIGAESTAEPTTLRTSVCAIFAALISQAVCFVAVCRLGPRHKMVHLLCPPLAIYFMAFSYYLSHTFSAPPLVVTDVFGLSLWPSHMVMWMCSTSVQTVLYVQLRQAHICGAHGPIVLPAKALLLASTMLWCGLLGSLQFESSLVPNFVLWLGSFASFYALLSCATEPLRECAVVEKAIGRHYMHAKFRAARIYVVMTWHVFPAGWLLGACGQVGSDGRELIFTIGDMMAKFLPVSVYISMLST